MGIHQASFRIRHECPYRDLSAQFPDLVIREWYLSDCQVLEITTTDAPEDDLLAAIEQLGTVLYENRTAEGLQIVMQSCLCSLEDSIIQRFEAHNTLYQPPTVHRHGWEHYTVVAFDEADIAGLYDDLTDDREIDVLSKTGVETTELAESLLTPVDRLFDDLTDRQVAAMQLALDEGYYEQPRKTSIDGLAAKTSVARSTYEEHLRKAENKLINNVSQFVRLVGGGEAADPLGTRPERGSVGQQVAD